MVNPSSERLAELKAFDETRRGVKGLVDTRISRIPPIFIHTVSPSLSSAPTSKPSSSISIPVIDRNEIEEGLILRRKAVVDRIRDVSEKWGFFQVVNHGIPVSDLEGILEGIRGFFEQDGVKQAYYSRDRRNRKVHLITTESKIRHNLSPPAAAHRLL
ncbi:hypothetical protein Cgig2_009714 [Carnegiea gigantea]|uniref:Non-haem dioxygenase N-terminal domain-containing protein n=1 Tax=Carnegiea gigantea TaxID=171969 RepID=A0A9Q1QDH9_9CARY|nr:hypothetical protein Cgig2_009714 [Carnegiea gigantea]